MRGKGLFGGLAVCLIAGASIAGANTADAAVLPWKAPQGLAPWTEEAPSPIPSDPLYAAPVPFGVENAALTGSGFSFASTSDEDPFSRAVADVGPKDNEDSRDNETPVPELPVWAMLLLGFLAAGLGFRARPHRPPRLRTDGDF